MAQFRDWSGWMATVEEVEPQVDDERKAYEVILSAASSPEEAAEVICALGLDHLVGNVAGKE